jgi:hypothetical protein
VRLSKGCVLGPFVILPHDTHLEASIVVANSGQSKESLEQDEGKLYSLQTTISEQKKHDIRHEKCVKQGDNSYKVLMDHSHPQTINLYQFPLFLNKIM